MDVNGKKAVTLRPIQGTQAFEVTRYLSRGKNVVQLRSGTDTRTDEERFEQHWLEA